MHKGLLMIIASVIAWSISVVMPLAALDIPGEKDGTLPQSGMQPMAQEVQPAGLTGTKDIVVDELPQKPAVRAEDLRPDALPIVASPPPLAGEQPTDVLTAKEYLKMGLDAEIPGERIAHFSKALELKPDYYEAWYYRAVVYHSMERFDLAAGDFSRALEVQPTSGVAYNNRGVAYHQLKQYDLAIADFTRAIELNPAFGEAYNNRGVARRSKGDIAGARADYEKAVQLDPTDEMAQMNLERVRKKGR